MSIAQDVFRSIGKVLRKKNVYIIQSLTYKGKDSFILEPNLDHVRYATLQLCAEEINYHKLTGNIAELGVYKGDFAKRLNRLFPTRKLYLFDTFEGFSVQDVQIEVSKNYSNGQQDFSDTSVQLVMSKMQHPENCIIKKGFFPSTAEGVEDTFAFISIDTDLYEPVLKGLEFFYPRLQQKGYIFIHDFNNNLYKGARDAVVQFCSENSISYLPIPDSGGTVIITK